MSSLDDWSPPVSPSLIAAMEVNVIPETCPSQIDGYRKDNISPTELSDMSNIFCQIDEQMIDDLPVSSTHENFDDDFPVSSTYENFNDDFPVSSTHYKDFNDGQSSPLHLTEVDTIPDSLMVEEQQQKQVSDEFYKPVPFCCKRHRGQSGDRFKAFRRLLKEPPEPMLTNDSEITEIFNCHIVMDILPEKIGHLFYTLKQIISKIHNNNIESDSDFQSYRKEIVALYSFLKKYILKLPSILSNKEEETLQRIVSLLSSTVTYVDRLSDMKYDVTLTPNILLAFGSDVIDTSLVDFHRFHVNLDLYWNTLEILYMLDNKYTDIFPWKKISSSYCCDESESRSLLSQMTQIVLWELVAIAISKFQKKNNQDLIQSSPFDCCCVKEMWTLLACLLNEKGESFWVNLHEVIQILLDTETKVPDDIEIDSDIYMYPPIDNIRLHDNSKFCMWMLTNVAVLINGGQNKVVTDSNYYDVNAVIKTLFNKGDVSEIDLRFYLKCCQQLCLVWEPNINLLVLFWDYFYKRMNSSFQLKTVSVNSLQTISKTPTDLLERCKQYSTGQTNQKPNETSYQLYLGLLGNHLRRLVERSSMQEWKQMKGRIYSKFHKRRIQELTETGLNNFTSLFLCLAITADLEDICTKLCGFYEMVDINQHNIEKCMTTWKGMVAMVLLYIQRNLDVRFVANKLATAFNNVCIEFEVFESDPVYRHSLWKLINVYLDGTQEIFDSSTNFTLSQQVLIGEGYSKLLKTCRNNEVPSIVTGLQDIISKIRMTCTSGKRTMYNVNGGHSGQLEVIHSAIFSNIYPAIKDLCQSQTAQVQLADILAEISLLALDCKPDDYLTVIKLMLQGENINKIIVCRYLSHIVTVDNALDLLSGHMPNYQTVLIQTWIRCAMFVPSASKQLQALNRSMVNLPEIQSILSRATYIVPEEPDKIIFHVFKAIQMLYDKLESWKEKIDLRNQVTEYTTDVHRPLIPYLQTLRPIETLSTAYSVIGYLVKCCSHLLYVKSKPNCPLPDIINTMIVPHTLFKKDKATSPVFLTLIRDHLHLFVSGLANLDFKRDPFIQRRLKDIVMIYLVKFWNSAGNTSSLVHPLVMSLKGSFIRQPSESSVCFRQYVLDLMKENFMTTLATFNLPENYQMALYFTREVVNRTVNKEVLAGDLCVLVCPLLTIYLQCESISTQQLCQVILQQMVEAGTSYQHVATRDIIGEEIMTFINRFKKIKLNQAIKTLEKLPKSGTIYIQKILPRIEHVIVEYESFRGTGQDNRLRQTYQSLIQLFHIS